MTLTPNRPGGLRGANGATLDDVVARLDATILAIGALGIAINSRFDDIASDFDTANTQLSILVTRLGWISGVNAPVPQTSSTSLYAYLQRVIGPANQVSITGSGDVLDYLNLLASDQFRILQLVAGTATVPPEGGDRLLAIQNAITAIGAIVGVGGTGGIDSNLFAFLRSIDSNTLRAAECCEDGNGGGGDPPPPITPPASCADATEYITTTLLLVDNFQNPEGQPGDLVYVYRPVWTTLPGGVSNTDYGTGNIVHFNVGQAATLCFAWNETTGYQPGVTGLITVTGTEGLSGAELPNWFSFYLGRTPGTFPAGSVSYFVDTSANGPGEREIINFVFVSTSPTPPALRVAIYNSGEIIS